jgi:hypothetical protein
MICLGLAERDGIIAETSFADQGRESLLARRSYDHARRRHVGTALSPLARRHCQIAAGGPHPSVAKVDDDDDHIGANIATPGSPYKARCAHARMRTAPHTDPIPRNKPLSLFEGATPTNAAICLRLRRPNSGRPVIPRRQISRAALQQATCFLLSSRARSQIRN